MILKLTNQLKQRGYKPNQIVPHINSVKFNQRKHTLFQKKPKSDQTKKLVFVTQFSDDTKRLKQILKKTLETNTEKQNP